MRVTRFDNQRNLTELVSQLYELSKAPGTRSVALNALVDANPEVNLRRGGLAARLDVGTLLVVPDVEGAAHTDRSTELGAEAAAALLKRAKAVVADAETRLAESYQRSFEEIESRVRTLHAKELMQAAAQDPAIAERITILDQDARHAAEQLSAMRSREQEALRQADETVATLIERLHMHPDQ
jgi:hypothetical protein